MNELRPIQIILLGFFITIFAGSILLTLPIAAKSGQATSYIDALFTATTSVCVTGLVVDTLESVWAGCDSFTSPDRRTWSSNDHNWDVLCARKKDHTWKQDADSGIFGA